MKNAWRFLLVIALVLAVGPQVRADFSIDQPPTEMVGIDPGDTFLPGMAPMVDDGDLVGFTPTLGVPGLAPATPYDTDGFSQDTPNDPFVPMAGSPPGVLFSIDDGDIGPGAGPPDNATELFYSPLPPVGASSPTKATEAFLGLMADPPPVGLDDDVDAYEDRFLPGPPVGAYFSADWDAPGPLDPGDIYWSPLWTLPPPLPALVCDDVTGMGIAPNEATPVDVDAVHFVPLPVCAPYFPPGSPLCFLFSVDGTPPPPGPTATDPGDIYITDCVNGSALFLDDVTQLGIVPNETTFVDLDAISVTDVGPVCELDGDGFFDPACGGSDCNDNDPNVNPGAAESDAAGNCADGIDNDCDGRADGADPDCGGGGGCAASANASVPAMPAAQEGTLAGLLAFLFIPVAVAFGLVAIRRRR